MGRVSYLFLWLVGRADQSHINISLKSLLNPHLLIQSLTLGLVGFDANVIKVYNI